MPTPAAVVTIPARSDLIRFYPAAPSRVVTVRHGGVWQGDELDLGALGQMLDAGICELTGLNDALSAWRALFDPEERIAIKVNCISRYTTNVGLALLVAKRLNQAGVPLEQITIYDRSTGELRRAGYPLNRDKPGLRCWGPEEWVQSTTITDVTQKWHNVLVECDALINLPIFKMHPFAGVTLALKNHYGSIHDPGSLHDNNCNPAIAELNAQSLIRERTRLIIGDGLRLCPLNWDHAVPGNLLLFSFDPVAHDTVGREILVAQREALGEGQGALVGQSRYIETAASLGLGTNDPAHMERREVQVK